MIKRWFQHNKIEVLVYVIIWILIFLSPIISGLIHEHISGEEHFAWSIVFDSWRMILNFAIAFIIHDLLIAPILVKERKTTLYVMTAFVFACLIVVIAYAYRPPRPAYNRIDRHSEFTLSRPASTPPRSDSPEFTHDEAPRPPRPLDRHDIIYFTLIIMGMGLNSGVKSYFYWYDERKRLEELEHEALKQQLDYLKYQVNPHFLMNTLNNIHALVDIDSKKAKKSIVMLSKMMRHILYDGAREYITIRQEEEFIRNYVSLMKLRYDDNVKVSLNIQPLMPARLISPLLFVVFIENAFKHGVSYQKDSFVDIDLSFNNEQKSLTFKCRNSKIPSQEDNHDGLGLENARRRLDLLFGKKYILTSTESDDDYAVTLSIPTLETNKIEIN